MKTIKRHLTLGITIALVSALTISIGATALRSTRNAYTRIYYRPAVEQKKSFQASVVKYKGELIPLIQLPEVIISDTAIEKKK